MTLNIKKIEKKLKEKDKELQNIKKESKDNTIIALNAQNKELRKTANELISKINLLSKTLMNWTKKIN